VQQKQVASTNKELPDRISRRHKNLLYCYSLIILRVFLFFLPKKEYEHSINTAGEYGEYDFICSILSLHDYTVTFAKVGTVMEDRSMSSF
jgi:hypothetical protein